MQRPVQQSIPAEQLRPAAWHWHRPVMHSVVPQHSRLLAQGLPGAVQHRLAPERVLHTSPPQHWLSFRHVVVAVGPMQVVVGVAHTPDRHTSPGQQSASTQVSAARRQTQ